MIEELFNNQHHVDECHRRWMEKRNRKQESPTYQEEWHNEQCFQCRYFVPLGGLFVDDYGGCSNPESTFDGRVMFEHDGWEVFSPVDEDEESAATNK